MCIRIDAIDGRVRERGFIAEADLEILETQFVLSNGRELDVFVVGAAFQRFWILGPNLNGRESTSIRTIDDELAERADHILVFILRFVDDTDFRLDFTKVFLCLSVITLQ